MDELNCISEQNWLKYSAGELIADEIRLLNSHCQNCEICSDIKEGIDAMKSPSTLESQINNIKNQIDRKTKKRFLFLNVTTISIAASILFGLLLFWFLFPSEEQIVLNPEPLSHQNESGVKSPEEHVLIGPKQDESKEKLSSKKQKNEVIHEQRTAVSNEVLLNQGSMKESVSSQQEASSNSAIPLGDNKAESDFNAVESKSTEVTIPQMTQNEAISGSSKESSPKPATIPRKSKSLFEPSTKKTSIPSANNAMSNNNYQSENIKDLNDISSRDSSWFLFQQADLLFNELNYSASLAICDSMLNFPKQAHFSKFVLLKTKILVSTSNKEKARDFLKEQIKKYKIRDQILIDYLKILKE